MKSTEFITDGASKGDIYEMVHAIKRDCQPYLQEAKPFDAYTQLMRGMGKANKNFIDNKSIRLDDRTPKDIPKELHSRINSYFKQKFGGEFRNALFASGDYIQAENYGNVYYIYPIGDFKYLYNPDIEDLFMNYDEYAPWFKPGTGPSPEELERQRREAMQTFFDEEIDVNGWHNTNLQAGIQSGMEIMIRAKAYHAISEMALEEEPTEFFRMLEQ